VNLKLSRVSETTLVASGLAAVALAACWWVFQRGYTLYYGDALAHLNIARRILDSRTPGYAQIGTVWLPLPHFLMLPWVGVERWWRSGLAGAIPVALCFWVGGVFWFAAARGVFGSCLAGLGATVFYVANPNVLYHAAIPMTEIVFFATLAMAFYAFSRFWQEPERRWVLLAALATLAGTLCRYEGWFLAMVACALVWWRSPRRWTDALLFALTAAAGPLYWLAHNWWFYGDPLEFYRGPYSAKAIYQRALERGMAPYPGDGDWGKAIRYYAAAVRLCAGWPLTLAGLAGIGVALWQRRAWPVLLTGALPVFYVCSIHSGGTPIFVPHLWPFSYYNVRYGLSALPLLAFGAASWLSLAASHKRRAALAACLLAAILLPWVTARIPDDWPCWKESEVNSAGRRTWTREAAAYFRQHYDGGGIFTSFGDLMGIFLEAGIPLRKTLHQDNQPLWEAAVQRPDLFLWEEWTVAFAGDRVAEAIVRAQLRGLPYERVKVIQVDNARVVEIYRRVYQNPILEDPRGRQ